MAKIVIEKGDMSRAIGIVSRAVSGSPIVPLLGNILMETSNGSTRLTGTNLEIGISQTVPSKGKGFRVCVPSKVFGPLVDSIYDETLTIELDQAGQSVDVTTDISQSSVKCIPADEFPELTYVTKPQITMPVENFKEMVNRVAFSARVNDQESPLSGVLLVTEAGSGKKEQGKFVMFATDGLHLSYEEAGEDIGIKGKAVKAIVRASILETISRTLPSEGELQIQIDEKKALFHCGSLDMAAQLLGGDFPDHTMLKKAIPTPTTTITTNTLELFRACKQLRIFTPEGGTCRMEVEGILLNCATVSKSKGNSTINIVIKKKGKDVAVGINIHFLLQFLEVCKTEQVIIELAGPASPMLFKMQGVDTYYHVIMPINT